MKRKYPPVNNNNPRILVVDDDSDISAIIKMALQRQGYDVICFTDPLLALEYFRINHSTCNLVISDLRMPQMNGFEFVSNIRLIKPETFVVIMSGFNMEDDLESSMHSKKPDNINGFIQKPISMRNLVKLVKSHAIKN
jgi:DNA-binding NtrC family response regulator